ncbi:MAG: manganese efflux pump MntP family protein [Desulfovibrio sp.]|jgi:putative Mn2+ efflux pump MntP|nr:manganese efflux pump MntP family protein [Desulfovibrio sp.]
MDTGSILLIAVALSMDAAAVSLTFGAGRDKVETAGVLRMAGSFGLFQFLMPLAGWLLGAGALRYILDYDHWLAFLLLAFVGGNMIRESLWGDKKKSGAASDPSRGGKLLLLALATSLDALAVGLSLAVLGENMLRAALIIGLVCFAISAGAVYAGYTLRRAAGLSRLGDYANMAGGLILIAIGLNILREHGIFS